MVYTLPGMKEELVVKDNDGVKRGSLRNLMPLLRRRMVTKSVLGKPYVLDGYDLGDDEKLKLAKWNSISNHIVNQHDNHSEIFPQCQHGACDREWLEKGSRQHKMVVGVVQSPYLQRDIGKLSPLYQTYGQEVFHSVVNHFAPKSNHFFYPSMLARVYIAAMHYNENSNKARAVTKDGVERWQVSYPKAKKGKEAVVKPCKVQPTCDYRSLLLQCAMDRRIAMPSYREAIREDTMGTVPPTLTSSYQVVNKEELINSHKSRFA